MNESAQFLTAVGLFCVGFAVVFPVAASAVYRLVEPDSYVAMALWLCATLAVVMGSLGLLITVVVW